LRPPLRAHAFGRRHRGHFRRSANFVRSIYEGYFAALSGREARSGAVADPQWEWDAIADRTFTPQLAARFKRAANADEPIFDWDFFIDGQDHDGLTVVSVASISQSDLTAQVRVVTSNFGEPSTTIVELIRQLDGWRISDFVFDPGGPEALRMTAYLAENGY
jgi:hypothetical protein